MNLQVNVNQEFGKYQRYHEAVPRPGRLFDKQTAGEKHQAADGDGETVGEGDRFRAFDVEFLAAHERSAGMSEFVH